MKDGAGGAGPVMVEGPEAGTTRSVVLHGKDRLANGYVGKSLGLPGTHSSLRLRLAAIPGHGNQGQEMPSVSDFNICLAGGREKR
jgi:hypothetical protein